jgi:hypothetical protein
LAGGSTVERLIRVVLSMVGSAQLARNPARNGRYWRVLRP